MPRETWQKVNEAQNQQVALSSARELARSASKTVLLRRETWGGYSLWMQSPTADLWRGTARWERSRRSSHDHRDWDEDWDDEGSSRTEALWRDQEREEAQELAEEQDQLDQDLWSAGLQHHAWQEGTGWPYDDSNDDEARYGSTWDA